MSKNEEINLFKEWDNIYRQIRKEKLLNENEPAPWVELEINKNEYV